MNRRILLGVCSLLLAGCAQQKPVSVVGIQDYKNEPAPIETSVSNEQQPSQQKAKNLHIVKQGDTLAGIAQQFHVSTESLAKQNQLLNPNLLRVGQRLTIPTSTTHIAAVKPAQQPSTAASKPLDIQWIWPTKGQVIGTYGSGSDQVNKGINIAGFKGQPIVAAAGGKVVFSGNGGPGYGNLIILQHNNGMLSVYGNLATVRVKEGRKIRQGQQIATMGKNASDQIELHFEIRSQGKPVNPLKLLPNLKGKQ